MTIEFEEIAVGDATVLHTFVLSDARIGISLPLPTEEGNAAAAAIMTAADTILVISCLFDSLRLSMRMIGVPQKVIENMDKLEVPYPVLLVLLAEQVKNRPGRIMMFPAGHG